MSSIIVYKAGTLRAELASADPRLQVLVHFAAALIVNRGWAPYVVVTSVKRTHVAGTPWSVHEVDPCRGCDLRTRGLFHDETAQEIEDRIDAVFGYSPDAELNDRAAWYETQAKALARGRDPSRPRITPHLHLQVPPWPAGSSMPTVTLYYPHGPIV